MCIRIGSSQIAIWSSWFVKFQEFIIILLLKRFNLNQITFNDLCGDERLNWTAY